MLSRDQAPTYSVALILNLIHTNSRVLSNKLSYPKYTRHLSSILLDCREAFQGVKRLVVPPGRQTSRLTWDCRTQVFEDEMWSSLVFLDGRGEEFLRHWEALLRKLGVTPDVRSHIMWTGNVFYNTSTFSRNCHLFFCQACLADEVVTCDEISSGDGLFHCFTLCTASERELDRKLKRHY